MIHNEIWLTPLILLPGVALLIMSTSARLAQVHTEFHHLLDHPDAHARILRRHLVQRATLYRNALIALYASVGLFSTGSFLGGVINKLAPDFLEFTGTLTMLGIVCLIIAAGALVIESAICLQVIKEHNARVREREDRADPDTP